MQRTLLAFALVLVLDGSAGAAEFVSTPRPIKAKTTANKQPGAPAQKRKSAAVRTWGNRAASTFSPAVAQPHTALEAASSSLI